MYGIVYTYWNTNKYKIYFLSIQMFSLFLLRENLTYFFQECILFQKRRTILKLTELVFTYINKYWYYWHSYTKTFTHTKYAPLD